MITSEECELWRAVIEGPDRAAAAEKLAAWLLAHDRRRGELLRKNLLGELTLGETLEQKRLWDAAVGVPGLLQDADFDPVPRVMTWKAERIGELDPVLDWLSFLTVSLHFTTPVGAEAVFANSVIAKIRHLFLWAGTEEYVAGEASTYDRETMWYTKPVFAALCASPCVARLETLVVFDGRQLGDDDARMLAASRMLPSLRKLSLHDTAVSAAGVAALRASTTLKSLRTIEVE